MEFSFTKTAKHYQRRRQWNKTWKKVTMVLASVVVFVTTYALILPAITLEPEYVCNKEAHTHTDACYQLPEDTPVSSLICNAESLGIHDHTTECYDENGDLSCHIADFVLHTHNADCFDANGKLVCSLTEIKAHVHDETCFQQPHIHEEACYIQQRGDLVCAIQEGSEHTHLDACYTQQDNLICTLPETEPHTHTTEDCYEETKTLLCTESEVAPHAHSDSCYTAETTKTCSLEEVEGHLHTAACFAEDGTTKICALPKVVGHAHTDTCFQTSSVFSCTLTETTGHLHSDACYSEPIYTLTCKEEETAGHTHSSTCRETVSVLTCAIDENIPHAHTDACFICTPVLQCKELTAEEGAVPVLTCEEEELILHTHEAACFDESGACICGLLQVTEHVHGDTCFAITQEQATEPVLMCGYEEEHEHTEGCIAKDESADGTLSDSLIIEGLYCGLSEHQHMETCMSEDGTPLCTMTQHMHSWKCWLPPSDFTAVETKEEWEATLPELQGNIAADLIAVAESQLGYEQVEENYIIQGDEQLFYSRYADWWSYGKEPYGDWNAKFVAFCLDYASINSVPLEPETATWPAMLKYYGQWNDNNGEFQPIPADLVFFDDEEDGIADRVGVITAVNAAENNMTVILENDGLVQKDPNYKLTNDSILGYARTPGNELVISDDTEIPENVQAVIDLIDQMPSADEMDALLAAYDKTEADEDLEAYAAAVAQVNEVYQAYSVLSEEEKVLVTNAGKLLGLEYIWSVSTLASYPMPDNFTVPVVAVNKHSDLSINRNQWQGYVFTKSYLNKNPNITLSRIFPLSDNVGTNPNFRCHVIAEGSNGKLTIQEVIFKSTLKNMTAKQLAAELGSKNGFFYISNTNVSGAALSDYYDGTGNTVEAYFDWKRFDQNTSLSVSATEGMHLCTINLNAKPFEVKTIPGESINAIVNLYNYDEAINGYNDSPEYAMSKAGYLFFHDNMVPDGAYAGPADEKELSEDGVGGRSAGQPGASSQGIGHEGQYNSPVMIDRLSEDGYPQSDVGPMDRYFDSSYQVATMTDGGLLFRQDEEGYWYYDSVDTAASYSAAKNQFTLYDASLSPPYTISFNGKNPWSWSDHKMTSIRLGNFLPFNDVSDQTCKLFKPEYDLAQITHPQVTKDEDVDFSKHQYVSLKEPVDLWFGMTMDVEFFMPEDGIMNGNDMVFDFHGDDDVFVYIGRWDEERQDYDYRLVLDIGGTHGARSGNINFATGVVNDHPATSSAARTRTLKDIFGLSGDGDTFEDYTNLKLKFYYMERGGNISYCRLRFNLPTLPQRSLTVTKELTVEDEGLKDFLEDTYAYDFRVVKADSYGEPTSEPMLQEGEEFAVLENGVSIGTGTIGDDGWFQLKAGQSAVFDNMAARTNSFRTDYFVEERLPANLEGQYEGVEYAVGAGSNTAITPDGTETFTTFQTGKLAAEDTQQIIYRNKVDTAKLGKLKVTKTEAAGSSLDEDNTYRIQVKLGDELLPVGTKYTVTDSQENGSLCEVQEEGILLLKSGQTASIIKGILAGTAYEIAELGTGSGFHATYTGTVTAGGTIDITETGAAGVFPVGGEVHVTVTNSDYRYSIRIPLTKRVLGLGTQETEIFEFNVASVTLENGIWTNDTVIKKVPISVTGDLVCTGDVFLTYTEAGTYYYKISEQQGSGDFLYDSTYYLVAVEVTPENGAQISRILKNGTDSVNNLEFVNYRVGSLTLKKQVEGVAETQSEFLFTICIQNTECSLQEKYAAIRMDAEGTSSTVEIVFVNGGAEVALKHGQSLSIQNVPYGTEWSITETNTDGYIVSYAVNDGSAKAGDQVEGKHNGTDVIVTFINKCGYELPETGGTGTAFWYYAGGGTLILSTLWRTKQRYRGRRVDGG